MTDLALSAESILDLSCSTVPKNENKCVIRLKTSCWSDNNGVYKKRSLTFLKRKSVGWNALQEDANAIGAEEAIAAIANLDNCADGVYEVIVCNLSRDWETGYVDGYDLKLIPCE